MEKGLGEDLILPQIENENVNAYQYSPLSLAYLWLSLTLL